MKTTITTCTIAESLEILRRDLEQAQSEYTIRVTFTCYSKILKRHFVNLECHRTLDDARLRASALGWTIAEVETL
jgi:hypothetical protein